MTDNTDRALHPHRYSRGSCSPYDTIEQLSHALAARDAACGHLDNQLVAKALHAVTRHTVLTDDEYDALYAATFQAPGEAGGFQVTE
jgi:hypothetical protein